MDIYLKVDDAQRRAEACVRQKNAETEIANQNFANTAGALVATLGSLAVSDPQGPSILNGPPFNLPGFTNWEAAMLVGAATYQLQGGLPPAPLFHHTGGIFDANFRPTGLLYADETVLFRQKQAAVPLQPFREQANADASTCEETDVPFDDHLGDITVPVLYVGAGGGFGEYGLYTTTLLGSADVSTLMVTEVPAADRLFDFGHGDLFLANDAQETVWRPLLGWLQAH